MTHKKSIYNNRISVRVSTLFLCAFGLFALKGIHFLCSPNQIFLLENKWYYISSLQILELFLLKILSKEALFYIRLYKDVLQNANFFIWSIKKILSKNNIITYTPFLKKIWPGWHTLSFLLKKKNRPASKIQWMTVKTHPFSSLYWDLVTPDISEMLL